MKNTHLFTTAVLSILAFATPIFLPQQATTVQAQTSCPQACEATSLECRGVGASVTACPAQWQRIGCSKMPCAYRQACGCGACLTGCNQVCTTCKGTPGSTQTPPSSPNVPPSTTNPDSTGTNSPSNPATPLTPECKNRCDRDNDGKITKDDFKDLMGQTSDPKVQELLTYCSQSCPMTDGPGTGTLPTGGLPTGTQPSGAPDPSRPELIGDCSGATAGRPDGKTDIIDIEYFRQELNKEVATMSCDFDKSGEVDIIDFTNYIRPGFVSGSETTDPIPTTVISPLPTRIVTVIPPTTPAPTITKLPDSTANPSGSTSNTGSTTGSTTGGTTGSNSPVLNP